MQNKFVNLFKLVLLIVIFNSCERPQCKNTNPIFDQLAPATKEYKEALANQMNIIGLQNLRFWLDKSHKTNEKELYELYVQGENLCAKIIVENKSNHKHSGNGGYRGAELKGVKINISQDSTGTKFILENIDKIID